ncbi:MAG: hypothetical protein WC768_02955 [Patescibacteria group bacterium]|jgi:hypothetical protein
MLRQIAFYPILGKPLIMYGGFVTLLLFITVAILGMLILKGKKIPLKAHIWLARISIIVGLAHAILGLSLYF